MKQNKENANAIVNCR